MSELPANKNVSVVHSLIKVNILSVAVGGHFHTKETSGSNLLEYEHYLWGRKVNFSSICYLWKYAKKYQHDKIKLG